MTAGIQPTCTVALDFDKVNAATAVGICTLSFIDPNDGEVFTFSRRIDATAAARDAFIQAAIAARNAWQTAKPKQVALASNVVTRFSQLDV